MALNGDPLDGEAVSTPRSSSSSSLGSSLEVVEVPPSAGPLNASSPVPPPRSTDDDEEDDDKSPTPPLVHDVSFSAIIMASSSAAGNNANVDDGPPGVEDFKRINDCIHGTMVFPAVAVAIIDTPQFQRLRNLKQTGNCHLVYPNATHNRFQHSLGVGHLGREFVEALRSNQPELGITDVDVHCVMIAGLCHDLGHGPYSHLWEDFVKQARQRKGVRAEYHHEDMSIRMIDRMLEQNPEVRETLAENGIGERDIVFIKELIVGPLDENGMPDRSKEAAAAARATSPRWPYRGRSEDKSFLYEIIANKVTGIDVDKWDYFMRDDYYLNIGTIFDYKRFTTFCRVMRTELMGEDGSPVVRKRICIRRKESENLLNMFIDRGRLHRHGYQHRCTKVLDRMLVDAWLAADDHVRVTSPATGKRLTLSEASTDTAALERLTDAYVEVKIKDDDATSNPELQRAGEILDRIVQRDLYKVIHEVNVTGSPIANVSTDKILEQILSFSEVAPDYADLTVIRTLITVGFDRENAKFFFYANPSMVVTRTEGESVARQMPRDNRSNILLLCYTGPRRRGRKRRLTGEPNAVEDDRYQTAVGVVEAWMKDRNLLASDED